VAAQQATNQPSENTASNGTQQKDAASAGTPERFIRRGRASVQDTQNAQQALTADANTSSVTPFQAVLSAVMPAATDLAAAEKAPLDQSLAKAPGDGLAMGKEASASPRQGQHAATLDPAFQITKEGLSQKLADAQVAFSARVVERAGTEATLNLRGAQDAIATSRFDTARPPATASVDPQTALGAKKSDAANLSAAPPAKAAQPAQGTADSQTSGDANANSDSNPQQRDTDAPVATRTMSGLETADAAPQTAQNIQGNLATPAPVAGDAAGVRALSPMKAPLEGGAPQLLEPQGESGARAGESVHNISLRLTNADQSSVQVRLTERAGELLVSVRTPDVSLSRGLRDGLPDLIGHLQVNGYKADTWQPGSNGNAAGQDGGQDAPSHGHSQQRNGSGPGSQGEPQSDQQQDETPKWVRELESSTQRSNQPWPVSPTR
jgi:hypothetical protein